MYRKTNFFSFKNIYFATHFAASWTLLPGAATTLALPSSCAPASRDRDCMAMWRKYTSPKCLAAERCWVLRKRRLIYLTRWRSVMLLQKFWHEDKLKLTGLNKNVRFRNSTYFTAHLHTLVAGRLFVLLLLIWLHSGIRALVKLCVAVTLPAEKANQNGLNI